MKVENGYTQMSSALDAVNCTGAFSTSTYGLFDLTAMEPHSTECLPFFFIIIFVIYFFIYFVMIVFKFRGQASHSIQQTKLTLQSNRDIWVWSCSFCLNRHTTQVKLFMNGMYSWITMCASICNYFIFVCQYRPKLKSGINNVGFFFFFFQKMSYY